jgi:hypothetical protein
MSAAPRSSAARIVSMVRQYLTQSPVKAMPNKAMSA